MGWRGGACAALLAATNAKCTQLKTSKSAIPLATPPARATPMGLDGIWAWNPWHGSKTFYRSGINLSGQAHGGVYAIFYYIYSKKE